MLSLLVALFAEGRLEERSKDCEWRTMFVKSVQLGGGLFGEVEMLNPSSVPIRLSSKRLH